MQAGDLIGHYEILSLLGVGGMGQVFRARDKRLERDVAIKVLPANFAAGVDRLQRFEQEARTLAALNHPNVLVVFDIGTHDCAPYLVSEVLEGRNLRDELNQGSMPLRKVLKYAREIASGLAAAHAAGIVHRDLKPENIFITHDGQAKILDFGLAKLQGVSEPANPVKAAHDTTTILDPNSDTVLQRTDEGMVLGTPSYMSPEAVSGLEVDHRADIFAFGAILYEMLSGTRAFKRDTSFETMTAVLREEPPELAELTLGLPDGLTLVIRRCLEKRPIQRFQSASDLAFALQNLSTFSGSRRTLPVAPPHRFPMALAAASILLLLLGAGLGWWFRPIPVPPSFQQVTFTRGTVFNARLVPNGDVVYSARWAGKPLSIFTSTPGRPESSPIAGAAPGKETDLLAVSPGGDEIAVLLEWQRQYWFIGRGTLAIIPLKGGEPRKLLDNVQEADWFPNGADMVITRWSEEQKQLQLEIYSKDSEEAVRKPLAVTTAGYFSHPRVSPKGDYVAYMEHNSLYDNSGTIRLINLREKNPTPRTVSKVPHIIMEGLAWHGEEVWFTVVVSGEAQHLRAISLDGTERVVFPAAVNLRLHDISRDGQLLADRQYELQDIVGSSPSGQPEINFSWMNRSLLRGISRDAGTLLLAYFGEGAGTNSFTYVSSIDGTEVVRLGEGYGHALSPDGHWVFASKLNPKSLFLMSRTSGTLRSLGLTNFNVTKAAWLPDSTNLVVLGNNGSDGIRYYLLNTGVQGCDLRPITPAGAQSPSYLGIPVSPDGKYIIASVGDGECQQFSVLEPGTPGRPLPKLNKHQIAGWWGTNGNLVFAYEKKTSASQRRDPIKIVCLDLDTGLLSTVREIPASGQAGILGNTSVTVTDEHADYVSFNWRVLSDLFLIHGLQ